jgi:hypothetical protein
MWSGMLRQINFQDPKHLILVILGTSLATSILTALFISILSPRGPATQVASLTAANVAEDSGAAASKLKNQSVVGDCHIVVDGEGQHEEKDEAGYTLNDCVRRSGEILTEVCEKAGNRKAHHSFKVTRRFAHFPEKTEKSGCPAPNK